MRPSAAYGTAPDASESVGGQRHDRISEITAANVDTDAAEGDSGSQMLPMEISAWQRMLSAVSGSVLTSLLGTNGSNLEQKSPQSTDVPSRLVTPLDVVRVRLQSQSATSDLSSLNSSSSANTPRFNNLPPNLGVTNCCREVFWITNNTSYCVASTPTPSSALSVEACAAEETQRRTFTSTFDGLRKIARNEGVTTLWRGLSPTLVMAIPANVIYFAGYDWLRFSPRSPLSSRIPDYYAPLAAGSIARVFAAIAVSPIEMFRTRMQAAHPTPNSAADHFRGTLTDLRQLVREQGYRALWRGLGLTLWRDVPFSAIYWWGYEAGRNGLSKLRGQSEKSTLTSGSAVTRRKAWEKEDHRVTLIDSFCAGAGSGAFAALVTTPFDVGKTRQQVVRYSNISTGAHGGGAALPEEKSMPRFLWHILRQQGISGLFKGWTARCLKVAPACAIMISSYEIGKKVAGDMNNDGHRMKRSTGDTRTEPDQ
jgi:solute carrier family 25, member 39/40